MYVKQYIMNTQLRARLHHAGHYGGGGKVVIDINRKCSMLISSHPPVDVVKTNTPQQIYNSDCDVICNTVDGI